MEHYADAIEWDTDEKEVTLPTRVLIPREVIAQAVSDCLSDEYDYCISDFALEVSGGSAVKSGGVA